MKVVSNILPTQSLFLHIATVVIAVVCFLSISIPSARASSLTESQIQSVVGLLQSFNVDPETIATVDGVLRGNNAIHTEEGSSDAPRKGSPTPMPGASLCGRLMHTLKRGDSGDDVARLQNFLKESGDFKNASSTGFFGEMTEEALQHWQARERIVSSGNASSTGFGVFGPHTREMFMARCKNTVGFPHDNATSTSRKGEDRGENKGPVPTCMLTASDTSITAGESVTLTWESQNATSASTLHGEKGPVSGSVVVTPTNTTMYVKKVFGPGGRGYCTATVEVRRSEDQGSSGEDTPQVIPDTVQVMAPPEMNLASVAAALVQLPFAIVVDSLANIFIELGIGQ